MGIDLTIAVEHYPGLENWFLAYDRFCFDRDYDLFSRVERCEMECVPEHVKVQWYDDEGLQTITTDSYGQLLKFTSAAKLAKAIGEENISTWNLGIVRFLKTVRNRRVLLYWH